MELNQTSICYYEKKLAHISVATESADSIVPDTFPDIGRIVCAYGTAAIKDQTPQNGRLLVSGTVQTTVLYEPENGGGSPCRSRLHILRNARVSRQNLSAAPCAALLR